MFWVSKIGVPKLGICHLYIGIMIRASSISMQWFDAVIRGICLSSLQFFWYFFHVPNSIFECLCVDFCLINPYRDPVVKESNHGVQNSMSSMTTNKFIFLMILAMMLWWTRWLPLTRPMRHLPRENVHKKMWKHPNLQVNSLI